MKKEIKNLLPIFEKFSEIKLVYFFGSQAEGLAGPMSDYDFAVYLDEKDKNRIYDIRFKLMDEIGRSLKTDKVDIVVLNITESPEIKYSIVKDGLLLYEKEPFKILIEPKIFNEYFDFHDMSVRNNLTKKII